MSAYRVVLATLLIAVPRIAGAFEPAPAKQPDADALAKIRQQADAVRPFVKTKLGKSFVDAAGNLPKVAPRKIYRDDATKKTYSQEQRRAMSAEQQKQLREITVDDTLYYFTKYGTPLAYCRALDILGEAGIKSPARLKLVDFGYGGVGHLRMLASLGADTIGVDVDPFLTAVYSNQEDQGMVPMEGGHAGRIRLLQGQWPGDRTIEAMADNGWDLFLSKNTLKNGYLHPAKPVDKRMLLDLGVSEDAFVKSVYSHLRPGGHMLIYNICPAPAADDKPYIPWADGTCPFPRKMLEQAGFEVIAFDKQDDKAVRQMGDLLGWGEGEGAMDLENDLFAWYTLAKKPAA